MERCNICNAKCSFLRRIQFAFVIFISSFSVFVSCLPNSNYEYSGGPIIFPGESPKAVSYQFNNYQNYESKNQLGRIIFPVDVRLANRPRNKQVYRYPLRRPLADCEETLSRNTMQYSSEYPREETAGLQYPRVQSQQQHSENSQRKIKKHPVRLNYLKKSDHPPLRKESSYNSERDIASLDEDNDNSQELTQEFIKWVQKFYPLDKTNGNPIVNITNAIQAASNETAYNLGNALSHTKCPDGQKLTSDGCKKTVPW